MERGELGGTRKGYMVMDPRRRQEGGAGTEQCGEGEREWEGESPGKDKDRVTEL